jgi:hypothetical protein
VVLLELAVPIRPASLDDMTAITTNLQFLGNTIPNQLLGNTNRYGHVYEIRFLNKNIRKY